MESKKQQVKASLDLELTPETQVYVPGKCKNCEGPDCPVCHGKGTALAVFTVTQLVDMAVAGTLEQAREEARKPKLAVPPKPKLALLN